MAVTGDDVITRVTGLMPNISQFGSTEQLAAVNAAIDEAWSAIKNVKMDSSVILAGTTYEYTPTATDVNLDYGFSVAYATVVSNPKDVLRTIAQRRNGTAWTIIVPVRTAIAYAGQTLHLQYNARIPVLTALTGSIELPMDYLWKATAYFLHFNAVNKGNQMDIGNWEKMIAPYEKIMMQSKLSNWQGHLPHMIPIVAEQGAGVESSGRYGQNIVNNP